MDPTSHLSRLLNELPGIGPRQSKRLAYALILKPNEYIEELSRIIGEIKKEIANCSSCQQLMAKRSLVNNLCPICRDTARDHSLLMVVPRDIDLQSVEKSGFYKGVYFVLGGSVPVLEKNPENFIRLHALKRTIETRPDLSEIILAYNQNPEGEHTARTIEEALGSFSVKISHLGRGLSTGTELEYSDNETLRNALRNRG